MSSEARNTVLDAQLSSLARRSARQETFSLRASAAFRVRNIEPPPPPERVSLKLIVSEARARQVRDWVEENGGRVVSASNAVQLVELPSAKLADLNRVPGIRRAEAPRKLLRRLDHARAAATGLDEGLVSFPRSGLGVVVGVIDSGLDWRHPDFCHDDGATRLELFARASFNSQTETSNYAAFSSAQLNAALAGQGAVPVGDPDGHGTHCASIAAGNGRASNARFRGVAPQATLMALRSDALLDDHIIWGIRRFFEAAGERPAVVSLSLGGHLGPHDGTSALENVIARETGPGRIVVVAAGNEGQDQIHFQGELSAGKELVIPMRLRGKDQHFLDVWIARGDEVEISIEAPDGQRHPADGDEVVTSAGVFEAHFQRDPINRDQNLTLQVVQGKANQVWKVHVEALTVRHGEVHAWAGNEGGAANFFDAAGDDAYSIGMPATEERAIAVASFVSKNQFETSNGPSTDDGLVVGGLSSFSSRGPTRLGAQKPDIAAPGHFLTAALAASSKMANQKSFKALHDPSGRYISIQGTSMATPFVAGLVALLLEKEPKLTPEEIQQRLRITARRDQHTGRVWHPGFGFGKLDALELLAYSD